MPRCKNWHEDYDVIGDYLYKKMNKSKIFLFEPLATKCIEWKYRTTH